MDVLALVALAETLCGLEAFLHASRLWRWRKGVVEGTVTASLVN